MNQKLYDLIIIGSGPAGIAAAIYAARAELDFVVVEKEPMSGGQIINTYEVDNYPGLPGVSGFDLAMKFREHCDKLGVKYMSGRVSDFLVVNHNKCIILDDKTELMARTIIIATGAVNRKLGVPGEKELTGMGVSYCATCDGAFFKNRTVAVVGGGDVAVEDAIFLARFCKQVHVIHRRDQFRAAKTLTTKLLSLPNVSVSWNHIVKEIKGQDQVEELVLLDVTENRETTLAVDGIFVAVGTNPNSSVYQGIIETNEAGYLIADDNCETNIPGVFAAGDVRTKQLRQVITAAADGANAITSVERYLNELSE